MHGDEYATAADVYLPWREGRYASKQWKCNIFVLNVVYAARGRAPAVTYYSEAMFASESGVVTQQYDIDQPRSDLIRRPRAGKD